MFCRRGPGQEFVRSTLEDVIEQLVAYDGSLEIDSLRVRLSSDYINLSKICSHNVNCFTCKLVISDVVVNNVAITKCDINYFMYRYIKK